MNCRTDGHWFASIEMNKQDYPAPGEQCRRCGIKYCPVAYDHGEHACQVCGEEGEGIPYGG